MNCNTISKSQIGTKNNRMHERSESPATVHHATYAAVCRSLSPRCLKMFLDLSKPPPERSVHRRPGPFPSEGEEPVAMQEKQR